MTNKSNPKSLTFASLQVARNRGSSKSEGGRYNAKTRRLVVPATMAGKAVAVIVEDGLVLVGGSGDFKCHPTQHFVTIPAGAIDASESVTLAKVEVPATVKGIKMPEGMVAYKLPAKSEAKVKAKAGAKAGAKAKAKAEAKA